MGVLVDASGVGASRPGRPLFSDLSVTVSDGDRLGVVGINGTGKSTLLRVLAGVDEPEEGTVRRGRASTVGWLPQAPTLPGPTVRHAVGRGWEADAALERLGMADLLDAPVATLSGGQAKRVALARTLLGGADLLVLDEPTNHLDLPAVDWLEGRLAGHRGAVVMVSHDRHLLDRVTTRMLELDRGRAHLHDGGYAAYLEARAARDAQAAAGEAVRRNLARREAAWLRRGAPARTRKPQARIDAAEALLATRPDPPARPGELGLQTRTPRLGDKVVELAGVDAGRRPGAPVLSGVDLVLDRRERLGVVGANGSGKSTLLDVLAGRLAPAAGIVEVGPTVVAGTYDQHAADLDPTARVRDVVAGPARAPGSPEDRALMEAFWFDEDLQWATVATLSGGERRRLQLLAVLAAGPNLLLLDEPTNDLDLDTLRALEAFLDDWPGAAVVVSHDRTLLERVVDRVVAVGPAGAVSEVPGGVAGWLAGVLGATPQRGPGGGGPAGGSLGARMRDADREVSRLVRRRDRLAAEMGVAGDHAGLARLGAELAAVQADLDAAEERWLDLAAEDEARRAGGPARP